MMASRRYILLCSVLQLGLLAALCPWMLTANGEAFRWLDFAVALGFYAYGLFLVGAFHALLTARLGRAALFTAESIGTFYLLGSCVVSLRFGVHLDHPVVLGIFGREDHNYGLEFSAADLTLLATALLMVLAIHAVLWKLAFRPARAEASLHSPFTYGPLRPLTRPGVRMSLLAATIFIYLGCIVSAFPEDQEYTIPDRALPGYATIKRFYTTHPAVNAYYDPPMLSAPLRAKPTIILLLADAFRYDLIDPVLTPNLFHLGSRQGCQLSKRHYSGSVLTAFGSFPYLSGMNSYNYKPFMKSQRGSAALRILRENEYRTYGFDASGLQAYDPPAVHAKDFDIYRLIRKTRAFRDDEEAAESVIDLKAQAGPKFIFGFFYSTHAPYDSPRGDELKKRHLGSAFMTKENLELYREAARHVDQQVGKILNAYKDELARGELALAFAGDHGEEFGEFGNIGHGGESFQDVRTRVPLALCLPGKARAHLDLSVNADVLPTILGAMGAASEELKRIFDGLPLTQETRKYATVSAAGFPHDSSLVMQVEKDRKYLFNLRAPELSSLGLRASFSISDRQLAEVPDPTKVERAADALRNDIRRWLQIVNSAEPADHAAEVSGR